MDGSECVHDGFCEDNIEPSDEDTLLAHKDFIKKKTFKDKFKVAWNFQIQYTHGGYNLIEKTSSQTYFWRVVGNTEYTSAKKKDYLRESIEAYTKSIAFAPVESNELSLAYANRSAVLFRARLYEDCLLDIDRALKSGYPDHLKTKLFLRQSLCFKALKPNSEDEQSISMSNAMQWLPDIKKVDPDYDIDKENLKMINQLGKPRDKNVILFLPEIKNKNPQIIGADDSIELKTFNDNKQYMIATRDIKAGEFVYVNKKFEMLVTEGNRYLRCWHCCVETVAGIPCDKCPKVIYCSNKCKDAAWTEYHDIECQYLNVTIDLSCGHADQVALRILIKSIKAAGGVVELKKKIDKIDTMKDKTMRLTNDKLDFNTIDNFLGLDYWKPTSQLCIFSTGTRISLIVSVFGLHTNVLGNNKTVKEVYENKKSIILGELIMRYLMTVSFNMKFVDQKELTNGLSLAGYIQPFEKLLKHSCDANVYETSYASGTISGFLTKKPIKQGETLTKNLNSCFEQSPRLVRFQDMKPNPDGSKLPCDCKACVNDFPTLQNLPSYQSMPLPPTVEYELDLLYVQSARLSNVLNRKDPKEMLEIKDHWSKITNEFHQRISGLCRETSEFSLSLLSIYRTIGSSPSILD